MTKKTEQEWQAELNPEQFRVCRQSATETAFSGALLAEKRTGNYLCACCKQILFNSDTKFDSGSGWPSFYKAYGEHIIERKDNSHGMMRIEVQCANCNAHLGHVFDDGPQPTGLRYCINSVSLTFEEKNHKK